jgi:hypothetical protein
MSDNQSAIRSLTNWPWINASVNAIWNEDGQWWAEQGSNLRHQLCKSCALPTELSARERCVYLPLGWGFAGMKTFADIRGKACGPSIPVDADKEGFPLPGKLFVLGNIDNTIGKGHQFSGKADKAGFHPDEVIVFQGRLVLALETRTNQKETGILEMFVVEPGLPAKIRPSHFEPDGIMGVMRSSLTVRFRIAHPKIRLCHHGKDYGIAFTENQPI